MVCAHRYIVKDGESQHGQGLCYVLTNDLKFDETYEPCKGRPVARPHEEYGYCQVGTSGALLDDGTMILGSPGPYTWRGTLFVISVDGEYLKRDKKHYYGPHMDHDPPIKDQGPHMNQTSPVDKYSYLGEQTMFPIEEKKLLATFERISDLFSVDINTFNNENCFYFYRNGSNWWSILR